MAAGADQVSAAVATLRGSHAAAYEALSAQVSAFHQQFVQPINGGAQSYAQAEATNAAQATLNAINAPAEAATGRPFIGDGANGRG
jgi:hypothetical protein